MTHYLENETCRVGVKESGAELGSFKLKADNLEYIWQADPQVWPRHAPVLFPIVGKVPDGKYSYQGKSYEMPQHGFARDLDFTLVSQSINELSFELTDSDTTLAIYPFRFRLIINYRLQENTVAITYNVQNPADTTMYFSIGAHPGFNCPLLPGESFSDYYLQFEQPETQVHYLLEGGLLTGKAEPLLKNETELPLTYDLFLKDALVIKKLSSEKISLKNIQHSLGLTFEFKDYPYFGIWTKGSGAGFICLEPWHGIASSVGDSGDLVQKPGIKELKAGELFSCSFNISIY